MDHSPDEMMIVAAARALKSSDVCFVGIGAPSAACNLARLLSAPGITLIYESGTIGAAPSVLPLSIGDGELCTSALTTVSGPEMFRYWLQGGWITVGFLGAAQLDRFGNINTTVIGDYRKPRVRLPGGGGAPEISVLSQKTYIVMKQARRSFVKCIEGSDHRRRLGIDTAGPQLLITDLAIWKPAKETNEMQVVSLHPGVSREELCKTVGWEVNFAESLHETPEPSGRELEALRDLRLRSREAHRKN